MNQYRLDKVGRKVGELLIFHSLSHRRRLNGRGCARTHEFAPEILHEIRLVLLP
ncbi:hypothetical protein D3C81_997060 [compost metagenome]